MAGLGHRTLGFDFNFAAMARARDETEGRLEQASGVEPRFKGGA